MARFATNVSGAMLLPSLIQVTESIAGSVVPLAMLFTPLLIYDRSWRNIYQILDTWWPNVGQSWGKYVQKQQQQHHFSWTSRVSVWKWETCISNQTTSTWALFEPRLAPKASSLLRGIENWTSGHFSFISNYLIQKLKFSRKTLPVKKHSASIL